MTGPSEGLAGMLPVVRTGLSVWDQRRLPRDEFAARAEAAGALCAKAGVGGLVVLGHAASPEAVSYLANLAPTARVGTVVVVPGHDPVLLAGVGGRREAAYQRTVTWLHELTQQRFSAQVVSELLAARGVTGGRLGIVGLDDQLPVAAHRRFVAGMGAFELVPLDAEFATVMRRRSVRELGVLADVVAILEQARAAASRAFAATGSAHDAAIAIDEHARLGGCRDVRILVGHPDGSLRPFEEERFGSGAVLVCYVAAEFRGYLGERAFTFPWQRLPSAVDLRPELAAASSSVRSRASCALDAPSDAVELSVRALGPGIVELPHRHFGWETFEEGEAISIVASRVVEGRTLLHSTTVRVGEDGPHELESVVS